MPKCLPGWIVPSLVALAVAPLNSDAAASRSDGDRVADQFAEKVAPILEEYCFGCHANGAKKGGVKLDGIVDDQARLRDKDLWWAVLKNVRSSIMPPVDEPRPTDEELKVLEEWIKFGAFGVDAGDPDPGRVTVRRLNRVEYRNTIRDLMGIDFDTNQEFPPDDTGHGFDNNGDVLTISPMLLEKYLDAATSIIARTVPTASKVVSERSVPGRNFKREGGKDDSGPITLSYYEPATASTTETIEHAGKYRLLLDVTANEKFVDNQFDYNRCRLIFRADGEELFSREFGRQDNKPFRFEFDRDWEAGPHVLTVEVQP